MQNSAPLAGIRVIEITNIYSGPLAGVLLAELGADVVKVESRTKPDLIRAASAVPDPFGVSPVFYALNRGKRFVSIDANTPRGRELLTSLAAEADVVLHNIRPGKPESIGVGYEELAARNPRLIYAAISGLGNDGPDAEQPVYDYVIQARAGLVDYQRDIATGKSSLIGQVVVDKTSAQAVVQGVLAALYVRERTGRGQRVDVTMLGAGLHFEWSDAMAPYYAAVNPPIPIEMLPSHLLQMPAGALVVLTTKDGEIACSPALPPFDGFAIALDRPDWVVHEQFGNNFQRAFNFPAFKAEALEAAAQFTTAELMARFIENGVAAAPVANRATVHEDPQVRHLGLVVERDTGIIGNVRQPIPMWTFGSSEAVITSSIGRVGEHTREVLTQAGLSVGEIDQLIADGVVAEPQ